MFKGIDVSNHQGNINWSSVKAAGIEVAYIKATEANYYKDPYLKANYQGARSNGIKVGLYHFFRGNKNAREQAEYFINYLKEVGITEYDCKLCLDIETTEGQDRTTLTTMAIEFLERVKELTGKEVMIYTGPSFANDNLDNRLSKYPCWVAHYGVSKPMSTNIWGNNYVGHQYSSKGQINGVNGNCDVDNFTEGILLGNNTSSNISSSPVTSTSTVSPHDYLQTDHKRRFVQYCLNVFGYNLKVDGKIGPLSVGAIKDFQRNHGLVADGLVGPKTWTALRDCMPTCRRGNINNAVKCIQYLLNCGVDGDFGPKTETAVRNFQSSSGIGVDGIVGQDTWGRLFGFCFV